jgi:hypothetical protein
MRDTDNDTVVMKGALGGAVTVNAPNSAEFQDGDLRLKAD